MDLTSDIDGDDGHLEVEDSQLACAEEHGR